MDEIKIATGIGVVIVRLMKAFPDVRINCQSLGNVQRPTIRVEASLNRLGSVIILDKLVDIIGISNGGIDFWEELADRMAIELVNDTASVECSLELPTVLNKQAKDDDMESLLYFR